MSAKEQMRDIINAIQKRLTADTILFGATDSETMETEKAYHNAMAVLDWMEGNTFPDSNIGMCKKTGETLVQIRV